MPVFISHSSKDNSTAKRVYDLLVLAGIKCYIDELDPVLKTTDDVTKVILKRITECSHLLAVVSYSTAQSWWVPFEIGSGSATERRISTYKTSIMGLPDYLTKWPIMKSEEDLKYFIELYKKDALFIKMDGREYTAKTAEIQTAEAFHDKLKKLIK